MFSLYAQDREACDVWVARPAEDVLHGTKGVGLKFCVSPAVADMWSGRQGQSRSPGAAVRIAEHDRSREVMPDRFVRSLRGPVGLPRTWWPSPTVFTHASVVADRVRCPPAKNDAVGARPEKVLRVTELVARMRRGFGGGRATAGRLCVGPPVGRQRASCRRPFDATGVMSRRAYPCPTLGDPSASINVAGGGAV